MADREVWFVETTIDCTVPVPDTVFVFDEQVTDQQGAGSWWKWSGLSLSGGVKLNPVVDGERLIAGDGSVGWLNEVEAAGATSDYGTAITSRWTSKWHDGGKPDVVKIWRAIYIVTDQLQAALQVTWEVDDGKASGGFAAQYTAKYAWTNPPASFSFWNNSGATQAGGMFWGEAVSSTLQMSLPQDAVGRRIKLTFTDTSSGVAPRILGYQLYYRNRPVRFPQRGR